MNATVSALKAACINRGLPCTGRKSVLVGRLQAGYAVPFPPARILSIDLGTRNCAAALLDCPSGQLLKWSLTDLQCPHVNSQTIATKGRQYFASHIEPDLTTATLVVVERQRLRTAGSAAALDTAVAGILMEAVLATLVADRLMLVDPKSVARYYRLPAGYREKKKAGIRIVTDRLAEIDEPHVQYFRGQKKKDDLADALLQAWAVRDWVAH